MEMITRFILNVFFSSIVAFYFASLLISLFRLFIRLPRLRYYLYLFPFFKVTWDLFFASHSDWVFLHGEKILEQAVDSRQAGLFAGINTLPFVGCQLTTKNSLTFSLGDVLFECFPNLSIIAAHTLLICTLSSLSYTIFRIWMGNKWQRELLQSCVIKDSFMVTSKEIHTPLLIGFFRPKIIIPQKLCQAFSEDELNAVLAHEQGHILWKDNLLKLCTGFISALFWFIPFKKRILNKGDLECELACDRRAAHPLHIAEALSKTSATSLPLAALSFSSTTYRVHYVLSQKDSKNWIKLLSFLFFIGGFGVILLSRFLPF